MLPVEVLAARFVTRVVSGFADPMPVDAAATKEVPMMFGVGVPLRKFATSVGLPLMLPAGVDTLTVCPEALIWPPALKLTLPPAELSVVVVGEVSIALTSMLLPAPVASSVKFGVLPATVVGAAT